MPYTAKNYTKVQFIAYHTSTFLGSGVAMPRAPRMGMRGQSPFATPHPSIASMLTTDDERSRVVRMYLVLRWAAAQGHVDTSSGTLKLFMGPEFYFKTTGASHSFTPTGGVRRHAGGFGAYSFNTMQNMLECLKTIFQSPFGSPNALQHWLIIPGTIVSDLPASGVSYWDGSGHLYLNTAPVIKGEKGGPFSYVQKYFVSGIDGPPISNGVYSSTNPTVYTDIINGLTKKGLSDAGARVFRVDNINFGLEVCLDHLEGVIKRDLPTASVDIHLITSCGMQLKPPSIMAKTGGFAMICDGSFANTWPRSDCRKITSRTANGAIFDSAKWDCLADHGSNPPSRKRPPLLIGRVRGRADIPAHLKVPLLGDTTIYKNGAATSTVAAANVPGYMCPEEVIWYEPITL